MTAYPAAQTSTSPHLSATSQPKSATPQPKTAPPEPCAPNLARQSLRANPCAIASIQRDTASRTLLRNPAPMLRRARCRAGFRPIGETFRGVRRHRSNCFWHAAHQQTDLHCSTVRKFDWTCIVNPPDVCYMDDSELRCSGARIQVSADCLFFDMREAGQLPMCYPRQVCRRR